jgi:hypothetical protein
MVETRGQNWKKCTQNSGVEVTWKVVACKTRKDKRLTTRCPQSRAIQKKQYLFVRMVTSIFRNISYQLQNTFVVCKQKGGLL